jgi:hypothetical protein
MTFTVEPEALRGYARQLSDLADAVDAAGSYITAQGDISWHDAGAVTGYLSYDSLGNLIQPAHERFSGEIAATLVYLGDLLQRSERALSGAASWYAETDRSAAAQLDATYPRIARPSADPEG